MPDSVGDLPGEARARRTPTSRSTGASGRFSLTDGVPATSTTSLRFDDELDLGRFATSGRS
jgi:hypothetical protein